MKKERKKTMKDRFLFRVWDKVRKEYDCSTYGENDHCIVAKEGCYICKILKGWEK